MTPTSRNKLLFTSMCVVWSQPLGYLLSGLKMKPHECDLILRVNSEICWKIYKRNQPQKMKLMQGRNWKTKEKQEIPPAWTQEEHRLRRIRGLQLLQTDGGGGGGGEVGLPTLARGPTLAKVYLPWPRGVPTLAGWVPTLAQGVPTLIQRGTPSLEGVPPSWGTPPSRVCTDWKHNLPSRTTCAVGR